MAQGCVTERRTIITVECVDTASLHADFASCDHVKTKVNSPQKSVDSCSASGHANPLHHHVGLMKCRPWPCANGGSHACANHVDVCSRGSCSTHHEAANHRLPRGQTRAVYARCAWPTGQSVQSSAGSCAHLDPCRVASEMETGASAAHRTSGMSTTRESAHGERNSTCIPFLRSTHPQPVCNCMYWNWCRGPGACVCPGQAPGR